ncbi:MAG: VWA domain-containing protein [FCB group bacterium]|nr:VWA domain-containing protein [FCB group bacterium]
MILISLSINWEISPYWLFLTIPAGIVYVFWFYRRTVPEISGIMRGLLLSLRVLSIISILILLLNPLFIIESQKEKLPELGILIDNSASMSISDAGWPRPESIANILSGENLKKLEERFNLKYFLFNDSLQTLYKFHLDSLNYDGVLSNPSQALKNAADYIGQKNAALLLISDGAYNAGSDPALAAERSPVPVYVTGIGDSLPAKDMSIAAFKVNPVNYLGDEITLEVEVRGYPGAISSLELTDYSGVVINRTPMIFGDDEFEKKIKWEFAADSAGQLTYELRLLPGENESSQDNNERHFSIKSLESRIHVLMIAGAPSADFSFLKRILSDNEDVTITARIEESNGKFYDMSPVDLSEIDVFIFINYPAKESEARFLNRILSEIDRGKSAAIMPGALFAGGRLSPIADLLPCSFAKPGKEVTVELRPAESLTGLTEFFPPGIGWEGLPPVNAYSRLVTFNPGVKYAALTSAGEGAIAYTRSGRVKSVVFSVHDLWRLSLQDTEHSYGDSLMSNFWRNSIRWLAAREEDDHFYVSTEKTVYSSGEQALFSGQLYDESYLLTDGKASLEINGPRGVLPVEMTMRNKGEFTAEVRFYEIGHYDYRAIAVAGADTLRTAGDFTIERFNPEYIDPAMKPGVLRRTAEMGRGSFYLAEEFERFFEDYQPEPVSYQHRRSYRPFPRALILGLLLALLSAEWIIRKRKGML